MQMLKHSCSGGHLQISFSSTRCARQHSQADVVELQRVKAGSLQGGCLLCLWTGEQQNHSLGFAYNLSPQVKGSEGKVAETKVTLVKEEKLQETLSSLEKVFSQHVYR